mgnify:CR=1 FL=1
MPAKPSCDLESGSQILVPLRSPQPAAHHGARGLR